jgi:tetratricopeptide (TPR) repeat protein
MPIMQRLIGLLLVLAMSVAPGRPGQAYAQSATPITVQSAATQGWITMQFEGMDASSGDAVRVKLKRTPRAPDPLPVDFPPGSMLRSSSAGMQNMVIGGVSGEDMGNGMLGSLSGVTLRGDNLLTLILTAFCAQFEKDNPSSSTTFQIGPPDAVLACIMRKGVEQGLSIDARQAAVWMYTDHASYSHVNQKYQVSQAEWTAADAVYAACLSAPAVTRAEVPQRLPTPQPPVQVLPKPPPVPYQPPVRYEPPVRYVPPVRIETRTLTAAEYHERARGKQTSGDIDGALADYTQAIALEPKRWQSYNDRAITRQLKGDMDGALADFTEAIKQAPGRESILPSMNRARGRATKGDLDGALKDIARILQLDSQYVDAYVERGTVRALAGDLTKALADYNRALKIDPKNVSAYTQRAQLKHDKQHDVAGALADYERALTIDPKSAVALAGRATIRADKGDIDGAIADYTQAIAVAPPIATLYEARARAYHLKQNWDAAIADFDQAIKLNPKYAIAYANRAFAKIAKNDRDGAIADLTRAIELSPRLQTVHRHRGELKWQKADLPGALTDFTRALDIDAKDGLAYYDRASIRRETGDAAGSLGDYTRAVELMPKSPFPLIGRAWTKREQGDFDGAIADDTRAIEIAPQSESAYRDRGLAKSGRHRFDDAAKDLQMALTISPSSEGSDYAGFYLWLNQTRAGARDLATRTLTAFMTRRTSEKAGEWQMALADFLIGQRAEDKLLQLAQTTDARTTKSRQCEAFFFIGAVRLLDKDVRGAIDFFTRSIATGDRTNTEFTSATEELAWLK